MASYAKPGDPHEAKRWTRQERSLHFVETTMEHQFSAPEQVLQALTHRSFSHEAGPHSDTPHYERLEFLGDAVLELLISHLLWQRFPTLPEGKLTEIRSNLVKKATLADIARELSLGNILRLGRGERKRGGQTQDSILADVFESLMAALYLDAGLDKARAFCERVYESRLAEIVPEESTNYKNRLQELAALHNLPAPEYILQSQEGPEHDPVFTMQAQLSERWSAEGTGRSKKKATLAAARHLYKKVKALFNEESTPS